MGKLLTTLVATAGLVFADYAWGGWSFGEMYSLNDNAPPNGNPVGAVISRTIDNADRLSIFAYGAVLVPVGVGVYSIATSGKSGKKKEK
ncbi:MAG: hypothetical protein WC852_05165 [Candidatus Nanoarchaeia archaeon]|jgi:hypothetical protein